MPKVLKALVTTLQVPIYLLNFIEIGSLSKNIHIYIVSILFKTSFFKTPVIAEPTYLPIRVLFYIIFIN